MFRTDPISVCPAFASALRTLPAPFADSLRRAEPPRERCDDTAVPYHLALANLNQVHRRSWRQAKSLPEVGRLIDLHA